MLPEITHEDWTAALDATVDALLWEAGVCEPPVDAFLIAMRLGVTVTQDFELPTRGQFVRLSPVSEGGLGAAPTIVLGEEPRVERRQFAVAHELGEFAAERVVDWLGIPHTQLPLGIREQIANALAGRLLVPQRWLKKHGLACEWDLAALKEKFCTASHELIARRTLDTSPPIVVTLFDQGEVSWRRSNFGGQPRSLLEVEYDCWQHAHYWGEPATRDVELTGGDSSEHRATIRCWPVHEDHWRREIMRTEVSNAESG